MKNERKLGIIGVGPRGLYAMECLIFRLSQKGANRQLHILLFEKTGHFGNGQVYDIDQVNTNWINISERILYLNRRMPINWGGIEIPAFPSYHEWVDIDYTITPVNQPDSYPPRAKIGEYLQQRFETFIRPLLHANIVTLHKECVDTVIPMDGGVFSIKTNLNHYEPIDEILLTIGHQPTKPSEQIQQWERYFKDDQETFFFKNPYPIKNFLNCKGLTANSTIGIRGFGLAMIDVVRGIATRFGDFSILDANTQKCDYIPTADIRNLFVPFSLDGLPPSPKPLNARIDSLYEPTDGQLCIFEELIGDTATQAKANNPDFLINAIAPIVTAVFSQLPQTVDHGETGIQAIEGIVQNWLQDESYEHPIIIPIGQSAQKMMQDFVGMATENGQVSLDYCIGQVWRHCQPSIYKQLSYNACKTAVFADIIRLDERMKRYAYGPPVESIQQLLALIRAGVMTLEYVNNPEIKLSHEQWHLKNENETITVDIMINTVLDAPEIKSVNSPIVKQLLSNHIIKAIHDDFGVSTNENGYLTAKDNEADMPIALLGRLAKGTIIGVDAILECFGSRPDNWAAVAADRHINSLEQK